MAINRATKTGESDAVRRGISVAVASIARATAAGKRHVHATREPSRSLLTARATAACAAEARPHDYGAKSLAEGLRPAQQWMQPVCGTAGDLEVQFNKAANIFPCKREPDQEELARYGVLIAAILRCPSGLAFHRCVLQIMSRRCSAGPAVRLRPAGPLRLFHSLLVSPLPSSRLSRPLPPLQQQQQGAGRRRDREGRRRKGESEPKGRGGRARESRPKGRGGTEGEWRRGQPPARRSLL
ncbi:uncharacterized protein [Triticum aestivum]|uniref:uncharacterized protein n=1 Tax=Triticum aestivum TaxID=4565 RepID=UPI001D006DC0|nr:uncharacterized protein LOC123132304 [Triticum aestivum]